MNGTVAQQIRSALKESPRASKFWDRLEVTATDQQVMRAALAEMSRAIGFYDCPCGGEYELAGDATFEQYAGLQRWLGFHERCGESADSVARQTYSQAMGIVERLRA